MFGSSNEDFRYAAIQASSLAAPCFVLKFSFGLDPYEIATFTSHTAYFLHQLQTSILIAFLPKPWYVLESIKPMMRTERIRMGAFEESQAPEQTSAAQPVSDAERHHTSNSTRLLSVRKPNQKHILPRSEN